MRPNPFRFFLVLFFIPLSVFCSPASDDPLFHSVDSLAPRDEFGRLHQSPVVRPTDYAYRWPNRFYYYSISGEKLLTDPAYVAALQSCLRARGYYCGPIDGLNSQDVSDAIARLQKNNSQRVTGTLTVPVRRALFLP